MKTSAVLVICSLLILFTSSLSTSAAESTRVLLKTGDLDLSQPVPLPADPQLRASSPDPGKSAHWIIHWRGKVTEGHKRAAAEAGARFFGYLPHNAFLAAMTPEAAARIRVLASVDFVGLFHPAYALDPELRGPAPRSIDTSLLELRVELFPDADIDAVLGGATKLGAVVHRVVGAGGDYPGLVLDLAPTRLTGLAVLPGVQWIEHVPEITERNNNVAWITQSGISGNTAVWDRGLHGEGQVLGHIDGGFREASCFFEDPEGDPIGPLHRKVLYRNAGNSSHGTHTAGTAVGDQVPINGDSNYRGVAYEARMTTSTYFNIDLFQTLVIHHRFGARVHSNSWGDDGTTAYTVLCRDIDRYSHTFEEGMVAFAVTNTSTLRTPENAKNVLAVGATNNPNMNIHGSGGQGPTADGRRKPEIYAPGCNNRSASNNACGTYTSCGTSMACPAVSGAGLLVRQFFIEGRYPSGLPIPTDAFVPSGALLRAVLLNSTFDMTGVNGYPSNREGWGWFALEEGLAFSGDTRGMWVTDQRNADGLSTGEEANFDFNLGNAGEVLKITLVFTDPPGTVNSPSPVINDLHLEVTGPSGVYKGNVFSSGWSTTGGAFDHLNTVERVVLENPASGDWSIRVIANNVPQGPQGYAIAVGGDVNPVLTAAPQPFALLGGVHLAQNEPNPFNPLTNIRYSLPEPAAVHLRIFDLAGRVVSVLRNGVVQGPGQFTAAWNGTDDQGRSVGSGTYFYRLEAGDFQETKRMVIIR